MITTWCTISAIALVVIVFVCWYFDKYRKYKQGCLEKISFQKFLEIYKNTPGKIYLDEGYINYYEDGTSLFHSSDAFYFSIPDTFRYERWRKALEHKLEEDNKKYKMNEIEKAWEKDAERHKEKEMNNGN